MVYHAGSGWDKGGDVPGAAAWDGLVEDLARRLSLAAQDRGPAPLRRGLERMQTRFLVDPVHYERMTVAELRAAFLVEDLFAPDEVRLLHWEAERTILGSAVPRRGPLALDAPAELAAPFFAARRELGVVNLGGPGAVTVDGHGARASGGATVSTSAGARARSSSRATREEDPGLFYLVSHPAHAEPPDRAGDAGRGRDGAARLPGQRERAGPPPLHPRARGRRAASSSWA